MCSPGELSPFFQNLLAFLMLEQAMSMVVVGNGGTDVGLMPLILTLNSLVRASGARILIM